MKVSFHKDWVVQDSRVSGRRLEFVLEAAAILFQAIFWRRRLNRESIVESKERMFPARRHLQECERRLGGISGDSPDEFQMGARGESPRWLVGRARGG